MVTALPETCRVTQQSEEESALEENGTLSYRAEWGSPFISLLPLRNTSSALCKLGRRQICPHSALNAHSGDT